MESISKSISITIENSWLDRAKDFAADHHIPERKTDIFLNTLAVLATEKYLHWADYETDLENSEIYLSVTRVFNPWGDLLVPPYGRLVCLGIMPEMTEVNLLINRPDDCIGFVVAKINENLETVELLGFVADYQQPLIGQNILIETLPDIEKLLEELYYLSEENEVLAAEYAENTILKDLDLTDVIRRLNQIYANSPEEDWLDVGGNILAQSESELSMTGVRESAENHPLTDLQFLAEALLDKIKEIREG